MAGPTTAAPTHGTDRPAARSGPGKSDASSRKQGVQAVGNLQLQDIHAGGGIGGGIAKGSHGMAAASPPPGRGGGLPARPAAPLPNLGLARARISSDVSSAVQAKCASCEAEENVDAPVSAAAPVQRWDCHDHSKPTCTEATDEAVQTKCAACAEEEQAEEKTGGAAASVQQDGAGGAQSPGKIHREARRGLGHAVQTLPHADRIQSAFGRHDLSQVRTSTGGSAETANRRMGALAYTSGERIAFRQPPDLHLAAHEAAHVVQQREGLQLQDGMGRAGDPWERHADRVADAVVRGQSAEPLLDEVARPRSAASARPGSSAAPVQHRLASSAVHLIEGAPKAAPPAAAAKAGNAEAEGGAAEAAPAESEAAPVMDEAAEGGDAAGEAPPPGVSVGGGTGAGGSEASGAATPAGDAGNGGGSGGTLNAPCYDAAVEAPPQDTPDPASDAPAGESQAQPQVTFDAWVEEVDQCPPAAALAQTGQNAPGGVGSGAPAAVTETGGAPAAADTAPAAATPATRPAAVASGAGGAGDSGDQSAMSGPMSAAEAGRDAAVQDYEGAAGTLDGVLQKARGLGQGVTFAEGETAGARDAAVTEVRGFMDAAAAQVAGAVAFARDQLPARLGGLAETIKAGIQGAIENEKATISARVAMAREQAVAAAQLARAEVEAEYALDAALIDTETTTSIATLDTQHETSQGEVDQKEDDGLADVNARFARGRRAHERKGPEYSRRAVARGQQHVDRYERCKGDYSDNGFMAGCLTVRRAKAQQDAACKTAAGYRTGFLRTANKKGYDLKELRKLYRCAVISGARQVQQTLDDTHAQLVSGLERGRAGALAGLAAARAQNLASIDQALATGLRALARQEYAQRQAINDAGYINQLSVEQLAHAGAAGIARGIEAAMSSLEQTLAELRGRIAGAGVPEPGALARDLAAIEASLGSGMAMLLPTMQGGAAGAEAALNAAGAAALGGLAAITGSNDAATAQAEAGFSAQMGALTEGARSAFGQITGQHVELAQQSAAEGSTAMIAAVAAFDAALTTIGGRIDEAVAGSLQELVRDLDAQLGRLDRDIASAAWKAAEKEQPAWKGVLAIVLIIIVVIIATAISIVTLGAGASLFAVILVGALVGAVSAGLIQVINNWASGEDLTQGVGQAMIMGAIGGAIGGALGFAGGALAAGAATAGARVATQLAITLTADLVAEGLTQTVGYVAFGQKFNWQGFVMAGAMSGLSFRAHPGGARPRTPHAAGVPAPRVPPTPHAPAPAARPNVGGRRGAITNVAGGAAVGLTVEGLTAWASGEKFDPKRAASAAASGAAGAHASRRGTPPRRPAGAEPAGAPPRPEAITPGRPAEPAAPRPPTAAETRPLPRTPAPETAPPAARRPAGEPGPESAAEAPAGRRPETEGEPTPARRPTDREATAELAGPANRMSDQALAEATTHRTQVGDTDHDFRIRQRGPETCTACDLTRHRLGSLIEAQPPGPLRTRLEGLRALVDDVHVRLTDGESGVRMIEDSARIAAEFHQLGLSHPKVGEALNAPGALRPGTEGPIADRLRDLGVEEVVRTETVDVENFRTSSLKRGEEAVYILRDSSGAVLKVGVAEKGAGRFSKYKTAAGHLGRDVSLEIAVVRPGPGKTVRDVEAALRGQIGQEGQIMPWDSAGGRLGRGQAGEPGGQGTPFVRKSLDPYTWTRDGRRVPIAESVAGMLKQGKTHAEIAHELMVKPDTVTRWVNERFRQQIIDALAILNET
jgi:hypothetical protein